MKKCIILLFEGYDGEFLFSLLQRHPSVIEANRSSEMITSNNAILLFAHPSNPATNGSKTELKKHTTFQIARNRSTICKAISENIDEYLYVVLRDTDGAITPEEQSPINTEITTAFNKARCEGGLHIHYVHQMIENWYISGLLPEHFNDSKYMKHSMKNTLLEKINAEKYAGAKVLIDDNISSAYLGKKITANLMGRILDIESARRRSKSFKNYIEFLEAYL
ncbi:hypothetical protein K2X92_04550 [Candidatus Gracilibacteria bacterium]|nr:hypothetical protein [Candidatus Gracilibacteria bacterium]